MHFQELQSYEEGRNSAVGIATSYGLDGRGFISRWGRDIPLPSRPALGPTQLPIHWASGLSQGVKRPGRGVYHPPHIAPRLKKEYNYTSTPPSGPSWPVIGWTLLYSSLYTATKKSLAAGQPQARPTAEHGQFRLLKHKHKYRPLHHSTAVTFSPKTWGTKQNTFINA